MTELTASMLLAPSVPDEPYDFYRRAEGRAGLGGVLRNSNWRARAFRPA